MTASVGTRPLTARSVLLSVLLGAPTPQLAARDLVALAGTFGITAATARVALTRMTASGDLLRVDGEYRLSGPLRDRQKRQDEACNPSLLDWDGTWEMAVVTSTGRGAAERGALRAQLAALRLAELREGVWLRPANLDRSWPRVVTGRVQRLTCTPEDDPNRLATQLWDLRDWASTGRKLRDLHRQAGDPATRFATAAAIVRHLLRDPALPAELLPARWPGAALRADYADYRDELLTEQVR